jgi:hypothetical protein
VHGKQLQRDKHESGRGVSQDLKQWGWCIGNLGCRNVPLSSDWWSLRRGSESDLKEAEFDVKMPYFTG